MCVNFNQPLRPPVRTDFSTNDIPSHKPRDQILPMRDRERENHRFSIRVSAGLLGDGGGQGQGLAPSTETGSLH